LDLAVTLCTSGMSHAMVTGPVTKWAIARSVRSFVGQTEYLSAALRARGVVMMFASDRLRVALVTRHLPLRQVPAAITKPLLRDTILTTSQTLQQRFNIRSPRLAVCSLNPHGGEGQPGAEEATVFRPVLAAVRRQGIRCDGPVSADGLFSANRRYDAVISPYHDQGLVAFKLVARDQGCQLSAGLPVIRTSPDHGSALDIAGLGQADPGSMRYAITLAVRLARADALSARA
jgi:4-hydroxythreonine-4-phosphate dehydrogenase